MASLPSSVGGPYGVREIRSLYPGVTENHLRYLEKWGLVRKSNKPRDRREYSFADLTTIKQVAGELERGTPLRLVSAIAARRTTGAARAGLRRRACQRRHAARESRQPRLAQADPQCGDSCAALGRGDAVRRRRSAGGACVEVLSRGLAAGRWRRTEHERRPLPPTGGRSFSIRISCPRSSTWPTSATRATS